MIIGAFTMGTDSVPLFGTSIGLCRFTAFSGTTEVMQIDAVLVPLKDRVATGAPEIFLAMQTRGRVRETEPGANVFASPETNPRVLEGAIEK